MALKKVLMIVSRRYDSSCHQVSRSKKLEVRKSKEGNENDAKKSWRLELFGEEKPCSR